MVHMGLTVSPTNLDILIGIEIQENINLWAIRKTNERRNGIPFRKGLRIEEVVLNRRILYDIHILNVLGHDI